MLSRSTGMRKDVIWRFLIIILAIATTLLITSVHSITDQQDASVLQNLYASLNSPSQLTGWTSQGLDPCGDSWKGVTCIGPGVTELNLADLGLSGSFNYMLQQLTLLHTLDISGNAFSGEVPYLLPPNLQTLNMERNSFSGALPYSISDMKNLTTIKLAHNQLSGAFIDVYSKLLSLNYLDLSFNQISGQLPQSFAKLQNLSTLYLQSNQLSGTLNILDSLSSLKDVNVENNQFSGWVPAILRSIPNAQYSGNYFSSSPAPPPPPYTPPRWSSPPPPQSSGTNPPPKSSTNTSSSTPNTNTNTNPSPKTKSNNTNSNNNTSDNTNSDSGLNKGFLGGVVALSAVAVVGGSITLIFCLRKKKRKTSSNGDAIRFSTASTMGSAFPPSNQVVEEYSKLSESVTLKPPPVEWVKDEKGTGKKSSKKSKGSPIVATAFSVAELQAATSSFSQDTLVGEGALGRVYRADMPSGKVLAVKKIDALSSDTLENDQDFMEIVWNISRLRHSNVAELIGYCMEHRQRLLVYDFYPKGTLHDILHGADEDLKRELVWNIRVKIALGAARSLEYLHEVCLPSIVHKNFKSGNILLDDELNPHLADCGIAVFSPNLDPRASNLGYNAPEHTMSGIYTEKSDVYSFGVAMLELLTGRKPLDSSRPRSEQSLVRWATPQLYDIDALDKMVDPLLNGLYPAKSLSRFADIIALCVQPEPEFRPPMSEVVQSLVRLMQRATMSKRRAGDEHNGVENNNSYEAFV